MRLSRDSSLTVTEIHERSVNYEIGVEPTFIEFFLRMPKKISVDPYFHLYSRWDPKKTSVRPLVPRRPDDCYMWTAS